MNRIVTLCLLAVGLVWLGRVSAPAQVRTAPARHAPQVQTQPEVIVAFTSPSCGPCQRDKPYLQSLSDRYVIVEVQAGSFGMRLPTYSVYSKQGTFTTHNVQDIR